MRKSKFSESQIVAIRREADCGVPVVDLLRKHGISRPTFFKWRSKYGGATVSDLKRLRELEAESPAEANVCRFGVGEHPPSRTSSTERCRAAREATDRPGTRHRARLPVQRACRMMRLSRGAYYRPRRSMAVRDAAVIDALTALVAERGRWGFWKLHARLHAQGHAWNHKRVYRVYCALC